MPTDVDSLPQLLPQGTARLLPNQRKLLKTSEMPFEREQKELQKLCSLPAHWILQYIGA